MTKREMQWAKTHDWFYYAERDITTGHYVIWAYDNNSYSSRLLVKWMSFTNLLAWAGY